MVMSWTLRCWNQRLERLRRYDDESYGHQARAHGAQWTSAAQMSHVSKRSTLAQTMDCVSLSFRCWWEIAPATLEKKCNKSASAMFVRHHVSEHDLCLKCFVYQRGPQSSDMACDNVGWVSVLSYFSVCRVEGAADVIFVRIIGSDGGLTVTEWILHSGALLRRTQLTRKSEAVAVANSDRCCSWWTRTLWLQRRVVPVTHFFFLPADGCKRDQCVQKRGPWWIMWLWFRHRDHDGAISLVCFHVQENPNQKWSWRPLIRPAIEESESRCGRSEIIYSGLEYVLLPKGTLERRCLRLHVSVSSRARHRAYDLMIIFMSWHQTGFSGAWYDASSLPSRSDALVFLLELFDVLSFFFQIFNFCSCQMMTTL